MNPVKEGCFWQDADQLLRMYFLVASVFIISSVQSLSCVRLFATPWTAARQASLYLFYKGLTAYLGQICGYRALLAWHSSV